MKMTDDAKMLMVMAIGALALIVQGILAFV